MEGSARRKFLLVLILAAIVVAALINTGWSRPPYEAASPSPALPSTSLSEKHGHYLFIVTLPTPGEIAAMLTRTEQLAQIQHPDISRAGIADAARIEVKMCHAEIQRRGLKQEDVPAFIELMPYGPNQEERLRRNGYAYL